MKKFNAFQIKVLLLILMLLDHLWFAFPKVFPAYIHGLSRCVSVMFAYFLVEGFFYTRSRTKYGLRLFVFAVFMKIGNAIINLIVSSNPSAMVENNIFATLFVGFVMINLFELSKSKKGINKIGLIILGIIIGLVGLVSTEGGNVVIPFIVIAYCFRGSFKKQFVGYVLLSSLLLYTTLQGPLDYEMLMFNSDFLFILVIPVILLYNGERGLNNKFSKYMFYVFYPLHLWLLAIIRFMVS
ncbi:MAG: TraX family protein [Paraclostridium sp.]|uniref:TraX family protein n=1 Tax=Paraclostridium sp. TaxID=2023273 RepID=UPI003EE76DF3